MEPTVYTTPATAVGSPVTLTGLGKLSTGTYLEFEFSNSTRFRSTDLVFPTAGTIKIEGSHDGKYWSLALTSSGDGKVTFNSNVGDYERVSIDGCVEQLTFTPSGLTSATHYRVIVISV